MPPSPTKTKVSRYTHKRCIVCAADDTSKGISETIKDEESFGKLMKFFWEGLSVEVKPLDALKHEFCEDCSVKIIEFYDTNEVLMQLEKHLRSLQKSLILGCNQGITKLKEGGHPLLPVHKNLFEKWGNGFKSEEEGDDESKNGKSKAILTYLEEDAEKNGNGEAKPGTSKRTPSPRKRPTRAAAAKKTPARNDSSTSESEFDLSDEMDD